MIPSIHFTPQSFSQRPSRQRMVDVSKPLVPQVMFGSRSLSYYQLNDRGRVSKATVFSARPVQYWRKNAPVIVLLSDKSAEKWRNKGAELILVDREWLDRHPKLWEFKG